MVSVCLFKMFHLLVFIKNTEYIHFGGKLGMTRVVLLEKCSVLINGYHLLYVYKNRFLLFVYAEIMRLTSGCLCKIIKL